MIAEPLSAPGNEAVAKLRHERSILRQANRALWAKLAPAGRLPECLRLSDTEARLLASLLVNASLRKEALWYALYFDVPEPEMPLIKSVEIVACHLRARLKPHDIAISTPRCGDGYFMSLRDRDNPKRYSTALFWAHISRTATDCAGARNFGLIRLFLHQSGNTKVDDDRKVLLSAPFNQDNIFGFDVAVHHSLSMCFG